MSKLYFDGSRYFLYFTFEESLKRLVSEKIWNFPGFRIFRNFCTKLPRVISEFRKFKHYKNLLRIVGGDSKDRIYVATYSHTETVKLIYNPGNRD